MIGRAVLLAAAVASSPISAEARAGAAGEAAAASSCVSCHGGLEAEAAEPVHLWEKDVHRLAGLGCEACHGGDPSPALAENGEAAMDPAKGFRPAPGRLEIADSCARCHSDAAYMKQFNPQLRVDQLAEYRTSVHGKKNAAGDPVPATCTDCHHAHGIRPVTSPDAPVYPQNVPKTCARCHADPKVMAPYGIPTNQYQDFLRSVHAAALLERGDTAAPACNDCHGNHGAVPPGVRSVAHVCGQCHGREATLFAASFKKPLFEELGVGECTVCHGNHRVLHPTPELFHGGSAPSVTAGRILSSDPFEAELGDLPPGGRAEAVWMVALRPHVAPSDPRLLHRVELHGEGLTPVLLDATVRPGEPAPSARQAQDPAGLLSATLRIEAVAGEPIEAGDVLRFALELRAGRERAIRAVTVRDRLGAALEPHRGSACLACHEPGDACDEATERMYGVLQALDRELRQAAARLRLAELRGMEVSRPLFELKSKGVTAAVEARAFIHTFDADRLVERAEEGRKIAAAAREAAEAALAELEYRRKGLAVSLILVVLVLAALYLKIRQIDAMRRREEAAGRGEASAP